MCVVFVERGRLAQAYSCLMHAHHLAPSEDYILRHLQIIQTRLGKLKTQLAPSKEKDLAFSDYDPSEYGGTAMIQNNLPNRQHRAKTTTTTTKTTTATTTTDPIFVEPNDPYSDTAEYIQQQVIQQQQQQNNYNNYVTDMDDPSSGMS